MTAYYPISFTVPQYEDENGSPYSGAVLKAYRAGTSTPISMSTDYTGMTLVGSATLNAQGYPEVSGNIIIPHLSENYKLSLYSDIASADSNTGSIWTFDDIQIASTFSLGSRIDIASASTINLNSTSTDYFQITGTTDISTITLAEGVSVTVLFEDSLNIVNSGFLLNISNADIVTAAGDLAVFRGESGSVVRMTDYERKSGASTDGYTKSEIDTNIANAISLYTSPNQTITSGGLLTIPHGLSTTPKYQTYSLVNVTAEAGYTSGEELFPDGYNTNATKGFVYKADATNIYIRFTSNSSVFNVPNDSTGVDFITNNANWEFRIHAIAAS